VRWARGVAVRGRFKGLSVSDMAQAGYQLGENKGKSSLAINGSSLSEPSAALGAASVLSPPPDHILRQLFAHYASHLAPLMVWLDSDKNEYRRLVLPLAKDHLVLQLAISAISAAHMPVEPHYGFEFSQKAYEAAIISITEQVREMNSGSQGQSHDKIVDERNSYIDGVLAAMLLLTNQSLLGYELSHVRLHRQATRILIHSLPESRLQKDELCAFLKNQASYFDIMTCTTAFDPESIHNIIAPEFGMGGALFAHFLTVVHRVTTLSGQRPDAEKQHDSALLKDIERDFTLAQGKNILAAAEVLHHRDEQFKDDFIRLNQVYFHAGMIYACRRLELQVTRTERYNFPRLLEILKEFSDIGSWVHNLPWPTFIAGTCAYNDEESQSFIINLCEKMCVNTGYLHYQNISIFLRELWQTSHGDWVTLAKEREARCEPIMAI
jgi:hypothetical protein